MLNYIVKTILVLTLLHSTLFSQVINIDKILKNSKKSSKNVILYFHRIGCSYCNSMQEFTLDDDEVKEYMDKNYKLIRINVSLKDTITYKGKVSGGICLAKRIGYNFYPSTLFLDDKENIKYASVGYKNESEFLVILKYIKGNFYKKLSLHEYMKKIGFKNNQPNEIKDTRKRKNDR